MPSIQPTKTPQAKVTRSTVSDYQGAIQKLHGLVTSCRCPSSKYKVLQSVLGGNLVLTSSSRRLIPSLTIRKPVIQLIVTATQGHLELYSDGGLLVLSFATGLILGAMNSTTNSRMLAETFELFLGIICDYIHCDTCALKYRALVGNIHFMSTFVKNILHSKPLGKLNDSQAAYISNLLLQVFLKNVKDNSISFIRDSVYVCSYEGILVSESKVFDGLLVEAPEMSRYKPSPLTPVTVKAKGQRLIRVAMVTVSMSGDLDELGDVKLEVKGGVDVEAELLKKLSMFCMGLINCKTGVVLCQRVIHPLLKRQLREAGVIAVDRLGLQRVKYVEKLTGSTSIQCLDGANIQPHLGHIDSIEHVIVHQRSFLHLTRADNSVSTLMLCHRQEQQLEELKVVCDSGLHSLEKLMYEPSVLPGGGCWQVLIAQYLQQYVEVHSKQLCEDLDCSMSCIRTSYDIFTQSLITSGLSSQSQQSICTGHTHKQSDLTLYGEEGGVSEYCGCGLNGHKEGDEYSLCSKLLRNGLESSEKHQCQSINNSTNTKEAKSINRSKMAETKFTNKSKMADKGSVFKSKMEDKETVDKSKMVNKVKFERDWHVSDKKKHDRFLEEGLKSGGVVLDGTGMCVNALQTAVMSACSLLKIGQVMENL